MSDQYRRTTSQSLSPEDITDTYGNIIATRYDVSTLLVEEFGANWQGEFLELVRSKAIPILRSGISPHAYEDEPSVRTYVYSLDSQTFLDNFPGMNYLYQGYFAECMNAALNDGDKARAQIEDSNGAVEIYAQSNEYVLDVPLEQRMETHKDQNYAAILAVAAPDVGSGGELVIANKRGPLTKSEVDKDATRIAPKAGTLLCFPEGHTRSHYVASLKIGAGWRIVVRMHYSIN